MAEVEHSDTDSSDDEDYKPETEEHIEDISDDGQDESESSDECDGTRKRARQPRKKKRKKEENDVAEEKSMTAEDEKKRADALWADFLTDVDAPPPKPTETPKDIPQHTKPTPSNSQEVAPKKSIEIFDFAGEAVEVAVENTPKPTKRPAQVARSSRSGGISSVLGTLGKKPKISTLEKTKLDWDRFKTTEGIGEDLERFNKGKDGYLERQDFLERTDYRQFDREREMRQNKRSTR